MTTSPALGRTFLHLLVNTAVAGLTTSFLWFGLTFWAYLETRSVLATGVIGGAFLTTATHGTDQMMVQRYLCSRTPGEARRALLVSGVVVFAQFALFLLIKAVNRLMEEMQRKQKEADERVRSAERRFGLASSFSTFSSTGSVPESWRSDGRTRR